MTLHWSNIFWYGPLLLLALWGMWGYRADKVKFWWLGFFAVGFTLGLLGLVPELDL